MKKELERIKKWASPEQGQPVRRQLQQSGEEIIKTRIKVTEAANREWEVGGLPEGESVGCNSEGWEQGQEEDASRFLGSLENDAIHAEGQIC